MLAILARGPMDEGQFENNMRSAGASLIPTTAPGPPVVVVQFRRRLRAAGECGVDRLFLPGGRTREKAQAGRGVFQGGVAVGKAVGLCRAGRC